MTGPRSRARANLDAVVDEVEVDLEDLRAVRDRGRAYPAGVDVEWDVPTVVEPGSEREPHLAHDL